MKHINSISVVICTKNRARALEECLGTFETMEVQPDVSLELIVVDNNSTDDTKAVIQNFDTQSAMNVKYVFEEKPGLGHARNAGIAAAHGEIIAFTDDDCFVDQNWLACIVKEFSSDPLLSGIGGRVELYDVRDKPVTIKTSKRRSLFSSAEHVFDCIHGCNMAFYRNVFDQIGCFDGRFGAGTLFKSAEDTDFIYRVYKNGFKMIYSPTVCVYHNHGRRTNHQVRALKNGYEIGKGAFYCKHILNRDVGILKLAYWEITTVLRLLKNIVVGTSCFATVYCRDYISFRLLRLNR